MVLGDLSTDKVIGKRKIQLKLIPLPLSPFLALKELQQFNSGLEYELKLENERLEKTITKLNSEIESLNKALNKAQE
jgi:hypothetical protein